MYLERILKGSLAYFVALIFASAFAYLTRLTLLHNLTQPELRSILKNKETSLLAKPKSPKSIAENILLLLKDKKLQERLKRNGRKLSKEFDLEHIAEKHLKLYNSISK